MINRMTAMQRSQRGVALIVGLVFLLLLTIIGLSSSNTAVMQERMAGNVAQANQSFQNAEGNLRKTEQKLIAHVQGGSGGLNYQPDSWRSIAPTRNDCTLSGIDWRNDGDDLIGDEGVLVLALRSEYDVSSDTVYGSPCRPIDRTDGTFGDNFFLTIARPGKDDHERSPAVVQSIFYWP